jgi:hypothetical protein
MSARRGRQSGLKARKMRFSPFWLNIRIPEIIVAGVYKVVRRGDLGFRLGIRAD